MIFLYCSASVICLTNEKLDGFCDCLGDPAREVLKDACQELMLMNRHVRSVFDKDVSEFKEEQAHLKAEEERKNAEEEELKKQRDLLESMDIESN